MRAPSVRVCPAASETHRSTLSPSGARNSPSLANSHLTGAARGRNAACTPWRGQLSCAGTHAHMHTCTHANMHACVHVLRAWVHGCMRACVRACAQETVDVAHHHYALPLQSLIQLDVPRRHRVQVLHVTGRPTRRHRCCRGVRDGTCSLMKKDRIPKMFQSTEALTPPVVRSGISRCSDRAGLTAARHALNGSRDERYPDKTARHARAPSAQRATARSRGPPCRRR